MRTLRLRRWPRFTLAGVLFAGLTLLTQYTAMADPGYDCGLRDPDGAARPAFGAWCSALA